MDTGVIPIDRKANAPVTVPASNSSGQRLFSENGRVTPQVLKLGQRAPSARRQAAKPQL